ncbi:MAG: DUF2066 domain-containing protein [Oceanospirillaceae bacterium]|nr:DUF2066 domain-containing protein [Oceanospirillaceae bacterium]MCP5334187.1 DUF2066 domain-containing protein [Oceanospirillaceae bacterium]MCP5351455.1 DUF2066 domain-containing protein [Oceanospirillaceae bacterium]
MLRFLALGFALLGLVAPVYAQKVDGLYEARLLVPDQSAAARSDAAQQGLQQVLVKVSGQRATLQNPRVLTALAKADVYVSQFGYATLGRDEWTPEISSSTRWLNLSFEPTAISRILKEAGIPLWGENRPTVLVWLASDMGQGRRVVFSNQSQDPALTALKNSAQERGVPLLFPIMDLDDQQALPLENLWGLFSDVISKGSERYSPDAILAGRIYPTADKRFSGHWKLIFQGQEQVVSFEALPLSDAMAMATDLAAGTLAASFSIKSGAGASSGAVLEVAGVNSLENYGRFTRYLDGLAIVKRYEVRRVDQDRITVYVQLAAGTEQFAQTLKLDKKLSFVSTDEQGTQHYTWKP